MIKHINRMRELASRRAHDESGVALLTAILFMILMAGISTVLVSVVLSQLLPTNLAQKSTKTIYAAQAGMQTALGLIRSATGGGGVGDLTALPCAVTANASGTSDGVTYSAQITYYNANPAGRNATWLADAANKLACTASGVATQPKFALVVSQGLAAAIPGGSAATVGNRTLSAVYQFKITYVNVPGGRIYDRNANYCLDAVTATAGSLVRFLPVAQCTNDALELWSYADDYELKLASTVTASQAGLCITGPIAGGAVQQNVKLQSCLPKTNASRWNQLWSWLSVSGVDSWVGENQAITAPSTACLDTGYAAGTALNGKYLLVTSTTTSSPGCNGGFAPSLQVGAGAASYTTHQIVNYKEFGRCADVTGQSITASYMEVYPCKQDATGTGANLYWNHKWYYIEPPDGKSQGNQQIYVYLDDNTNQKYCLTAPTPASGSIYPIFSACVAGSAQQKWTRWYTGANYAASYVFMDAYNRCLDADSTPPLHKDLYSKITVAQCDGTTEQKWNAPADTGSAGVSSFKEVSP